MGGIGSGRHKDPPKPKKLLKEVIPVNEMFEEDELEIYNSLVDIYMGDFQEDDLTYSDTDDIMSLAMNKVFEFRLLKTSKGNPNKQMDISQAIEKLRKQSDKFKENLSSRRRDRIDPNKYKGFSIVDLAVAFDQDKKSVFEEKNRQLKKEEQEVLKKRKDYKGNRYDLDSKKGGKED